MAKISTIRAVTVAAVLLGAASILLSLALPQFAVILWGLALLLFFTALACALQQNAIRRKHRQ